MDFAWEKFLEDKGFDKDMVQRIGKASVYSSDWKEFTIDKNFRGKKLHITVKNPQGKESGFTSLTLNGEALADNYIPADKLADTNEIELMM